MMLCCKQHILSSMLYTLNLLVLIRKPFILMTIKLRNVHSMACDTTIRPLDNPKSLIKPRRTELERETEP